MSLRELLLTLVVLTICMVAFVRPRIGLYGYIWYAVMRPDVLAWCEDARPFSTFLAVSTLIGSVLYLGRMGRLFQSWISNTFLLLQIPLLASTVLAVNPDLSYVRYTDFFKSYLVLLLIPVLIETADQLKVLILLIGLSVGVIGVKFGGFGLIHGGVILINGYGGQMSDNNLVGLALAMMVPLCWYGRTLVENKLVRLALLGIVGVSIGAIVMTNSRGSSLALGTVFLCFLFRSRHKFGLAIVLVIMAGGAIYLVQDEYVNRMQTIATYEEEASANSRIEHARAAFRMWQDYPIFGVGFGGLNYAHLASKYLGKENIHVAHNTYLQMLVDSGMFALPIYLTLLWGTIFWIGRTIRKLAHQPGLAIMGAALQTSLIAFSIGCTFYSSQRYDLPYILLLSCAAWHLQVRHVLADAEEPVERAEDVESQPAFS